MQRLLEHVQERLKRAEEAGPAAGGVAAADTEARQVIAEQQSMIGELKAEGEGQLEMIGSLELVRICIF